jgi:transcriptional regulator with XRE-family HTH domain
MTTGQQSSPGLGTLIRQARTDAELTQERLAELVSGAAGRRTNRLQVLNWEAGRHQPRFESLQAIATVTGKPISFFFANGADL